MNMEGEWFTGDEVSHDDCENPEPGGDVMEGCEDASFLIHQIANNVVVFLKTK